jgi:hypothetical protein
MKTLGFNLIRDQEQISVNFTITKMVNAGFAGRDQESVDKHIEELKKEGVPTPEHTPTLYPVSPYMVTQEDSVYVLDGQTSGEAEYVLMIKNNDVYVGVGSDHTDRALEIDSIPKSKQIYPNVISKEIWLFEDIRDVWDELLLRSWAIIEKERRLYQKARLSALLAPDVLLNFVQSNSKGKSLDGTLIYSGTVPLYAGEMLCGEQFEVELLNPSNQMRLTCSYRINLMDFLTESDKSA